MRILALIGSYRKRGNTARVVEMIIEQMKQIAADHHEPLIVETINLGHSDISFCRGCRVCFNKGEDRCPLKDDLLSIKARMAAADGLIIASPVYVNDVSGITKNWIDRLAFVTHRPEFAGKCAYVVTTVGDGPSKHALRTMQMALNFWGYFVVGQAGFKTGAYMKQEEMEGRYQKQTEKIARQLFQAIYQRQYSRPSFLALMTFKIQQRYWQRADQDSIDRRYWRQQGWTASGRSFYTGHEASPVKVGLARAAGGILARFVT